MAQELTLEPKEYMKKMEENVAEAQRELFIARIGSALVRLKCLIIIYSRILNTTNVKDLIEIQNFLY